MWDKSQAPFGWGRGMMMTDMSARDAQTRAVWAHSAWLVCAGLGVLGLLAAGYPVQSGPIPALMIASTAPLLILAAHGFGMNFRASLAPLAGLIVWTLCLTMAVVVAGAAWGAYILWFAAPLAAAVLLRRGAPIWEAAALAGLGLVTSGVLAVMSTNSAPLAPRDPHGVLAGLFIAAPLLAFLVSVFHVLRAQQTLEQDHAAQKASQSHALFATAEAVVLRLSPHDRVVEAIGDGEAFMGLACTEMTGEQALNLVDPSSAQSLRDSIHHTRRTGEASQVRVTVLGRPLRARFTSGAGAEVHVALRRDAPTDTRVAHLEARHAAAVADAESKVQFYARLSHELRTPLNAVLGFADIMRAKMFGPMPVKYAEYVDLIHESAHHLLGLVDSVMDLSKIEAGAYPLEMALFDARDVLDAATRMTAVLAEKKGVVLEAEHRGAPLIVEGDARALRQIFINLIGNAVKFTPSGGTVRARVLQRDGEALFEVEDTGAGMTPDEVAALGQPYTQTQAGRESETGTGLGLAIVKALATMHGGTFEAESTLGDGTTVRVRAPILAASPDMASIA